MNGYSRTTLIGTLSLIIVFGSSARLTAQGPGTQTPFGPIPTPPQAPGQPSPFQINPPPIPPQATTDEISVLQKCYQSLQDPPACQRLVADQANWDVRFFDVKYANLEALREALSIFRANFNVSSSLRVLAVRAPKEIMPAIEDAIKRLDVQPAPKKSVELTMYLLKATDQQSGSPIPQVLQSVVNQLKTVLAYKGYEVMDTQVVRGTDGSKVSTSGSLPGVSLAPTLSIFYNFNASLRVRTADQKTPVLLLENMRFGARVPVSTSAGQFQYSDIGISSDVDIAAGQQVIVGKTSMGETALILVISAKFSD